MDPWLGTTVVREEVTEEKISVHEIVRVNKQANM